MTMIVLALAVFIIIYSGIAMAQSTATLKISASPIASTYGEEVNFTTTAIDSAIGGTTPSGTVTLKDGNQDLMTAGLSTSVQTTKRKVFLFYNVAPKLMRYGLMETYKAAGIKYDQARTSKDGLRFLALVHSKKTKEK
jgi:hypothetical protein